MIQIKKTILTLVALLAVTGAWAADVLNLVVDGTSATIKYDGNANNNPILGSTDWEQSGYGWDEEYTTRPTITTVTIDESCKNFSGTSLHGLLFWFSGLTTINGLENLNTANVQDMEYMFAGCSKLTSLDLSSFNTASVTTMFCMFEGCSKLTTVDLSSWNTENVEKINALFNECSELTTVDLSSWNTAKVWNTGYMFYNCSKLENIYVGDGWSTTKVTNSSSMFDGCTKLLSMNTANPAIDKTNAHTGDGGYLKVKPASSGPEVAWTAASNTGTFKMPGGNVTLEPEYYPQAVLAAAPTAINDVPATTDGAIVNAGTVANIGETTNAQGTVMYHVSQSALDDAALLALTADQWTADVPTAADLAQGQAYVYYYVRGNDGDNDETTFSDGDIVKAANALTVTIAAAPTYAVTFAEGVNPEPPAEPEWTADPATGVTKGQTVTVTYNGSKKVIGVKAEKKAAAPASIPLDNTTTAWTAGSYAVPAGGLTYSDAITVSGDVTLTLTDGETLTLNKGISLASGATLTIQGNGTMNVNGTNNSTASTVAGSTGTLILTSGTLNAKGGNGQDMTDGFKTGASGGAAINGSVTVNGGSLTANGGNGGNCIGATIGPETNGGAGGAAISGDVTITDGAVAATGGNGGSIGASNYGEEVHGGAGGAAIGGNATLTGGTLTATQGANGTGSLEDSSVGAGGKAVAGTVTNNGGTVN